MGINLNTANDTTISNNNVSASVQKDNDKEELAQIMLVSGWTKQQNGLYVGYNMVGTVSTQFGVACPVLAFKAGADFDSFKLEAKVGQFGRNTITTTGFDAQFGNDCVLLGESATASKAAQLSYISKNTVLSVGHQGGESVYKFSTVAGISALSRVLAMSAFPVVLTLLKRRRDLPLLTGPMVSTIR